MSTSNNESDQFYLTRDSQQQGPFTLSQLQSMWRNGLITAADYYWQDGFAEWLPITTIQNQLELPATASNASEQIAVAQAKQADIMGITLLVIPIAVSALMWIVVSQMNLLQNPLNMLSIFGIVIVAGTSVVMAIDASLLGMGKPIDGKSTTSPFVWFLGGLLLWIVVYPTYLHQRSRFGRYNFVMAGILSLSVFLGISVLLGYNIQTQIYSVRKNLEKIQQAANAVTPPATRSNGAQKGLINGQVFIATQSGANYKLGLAQIALCDPASAKKYFGEYFAQMSEEINKQTPGFNNLLPQTESELQTYNEKWIAYDAAKKSCKECYDRLRGMSDTSNYSMPSFDEIFKGSRGKRKYEFQAKPEVYMEDFVKVADEFREKCAIMQIAGVEYDLLRKKVSPMYHRLLSIIKDQRDIIKGQMNSIFNNIPTIATTRTDADGVFSISADCGKSYFLVASAQRQVDEYMGEFFIPLNC